MEASNMTLTLDSTDKYIIYSGTKGSENELYLYYEE